MKKISTLLFDLGNVLAYIDFDAFWRSLGFLNAIDKAPFVQGYKELTLQYETGFISTNEYLNGLKSVFGNRFDRERLEQAFVSIMLEPVGGMIELVKQVSRTRRTALVSNTNEIHYRISLQKFEVLSVLHKHYLSYKMRVMKPAQGFYDAIIKDQKIDPSEILFIDDLIKNVKGAQAAGMQAVKFENLWQLEKALITFGILP